MKTPTKILLIVAVLALGVICLWMVSGNIRHTPETRDIKEQNRSLSETLTERTPDLTEPDEKAKFDSFTDMLEGTPQY